MNEDLLKVAYQNYQTDKCDVTREKLLEYKELSQGDYSLFFNNPTKYTLKYLLFAIDILLELELNEFMPKPISVSLYYDFCSYIDNEKHHDLFQSPNPNLQNLTKEVFETYPDLYNYDGSLNISNVIVRDREFIFKNRAKVLFFEYLIKRYGEVLETKDEKDINLKSIKVYNHFVKFILKMNSNLVEITQRREREKMLANLSHRLKNLMCDIRGCFDYIERKNEIISSLRIKEHINLVCRIIDSLNYSGTGNVNDFYYDAKDISSSKKDLNELILTAFNSAISNIFSTTLNEKFRTNYFSTYESLDAANDKFRTLSLTFNSFNKYCNEKFFNFDFEVKGFSNLKIGNTKGSYIRFYILFEEIFLNAIKYISFVPKENRKFKVEFLYSQKGINLKIENNYMSKRMEKGTGFGTHIVSSIVASMNGNYEVIKGGDIYTTNIYIPNFWNRKEELIEYKIKKSNPISMVGEKQDNYK